MGSLFPKRAHFAPYMSLRNDTGESEVTRLSARWLPRLSSGRWQGSAREKGERSVVERPLSGRSRLPTRDPLPFSRRCGCRREGSRPAGCRCRDTRTWSQATDGWFPLRPFATLFFEGVARGEEREQAEADGRTREERVGSSADWGRAEKRRRRRGARGTVASRSLSRALVGRQRPRRGGGGWRQPRPLGGGARGATAGAAGLVTATAAESTRAVARNCTWRWRWPHLGEDGGHTCSDDGGYGIRERRRPPTRIVGGGS